MRALDGDHTRRSAAHVAVNALRVESGIDGRAGNRQLATAGMREAPRKERVQLGPRRVAHRVADAEQFAPEEHPALLAAAEAEQENGQAIGLHVDAGRHEGYPRIGNRQRLVGLGAGAQGLPRERFAALGLPELGVARCSTCWARGALAISALSFSGQSGSFPGNRVIRKSDTVWISMRRSRLKPRGGWV
jgi:hypothetical protein